jgi:DNA-directed RNA polymerase specialized sigma subunit
MKITITVHPVKDSIYSRLKSRLGREPSSSEIAAEVKRILREAKTGA